MKFSTASFLAAIVLSYTFTNFAEAALPRSPSLDSKAVTVEAKGHVPGFAEVDLPAYIVRQMHEEVPGPWQFSVGSSGAAPAPNRVLWSFKILHTEWKGASHRGFTSPPNSASYLSAEVELYLHNSYQMTMIVQPSIIGGPDDRVLSEAVRNVAHVLFIENRRDAP
jgi:hypothetical protein